MRLSRRFARKGALTDVAGHGISYYIGRAASGSVTPTYTKTGCTTQIVGTDDLQTYRKPLAPSQTAEPQGHPRWAALWRRDLDCEAGGLHHTPWSTVGRVQHLQRHVHERAYELEELRRLSTGTWKGLLRQVRPTWRI